MNQKFSHLQVGDPVVIRTFARYEDCTVIEITKAGNIKLNNNKLFRPDGTEYGRGYNNLIENTPEIQEERRRIAILAQLRDIKIGEYSTDQLAAVLKMYQRFDEESKQKEN